MDANLGEGHSRVCPPLEGQRHAGKARPKGAHSKIRVPDTRNQNGLRDFSRNPLIYLAEWTGLEPTTPRVTGRWRAPISLNAPRELFKDPHETDSFLQPLEVGPKVFHVLASEMSEILNHAANDDEAIEASLTRTT